MPKSQVKPFRPKISEIQNLLRDPGDDVHWIDDEGRIYGFMNSVYSRLLWKSGLLGEDEAHLWVLLPKRSRRVRKNVAITIFPRPGQGLDLRPYLSPKSHPRLRIMIIRYLTRPIRQRAGALIAEIDPYSKRIKIPMGRGFFDNFDEKEEEEDIQKVRE